MLVYRLKWLELEKKYTCTTTNKPISERSKEEKKIVFNTSNYMCTNTHNAIEREPYPILLLYALVSYKSFVLFRRVFNNG